MSLHPLWLALVALLPAGATWWTGRRLLRRGLEDPELPERLMRRRGRMGMLWGAALVVLLALGERHALWAVPLMIGASMAASFPAQRALLDERWGMGAYLWHSARRLVAGLAFWIALVFAPSFVMGTRDPERAAPLAVALGAGLVLWLLNARRIWLRMHGATPLGALRPELDGRFAAVMARATTTPPLLFRFGQPGERRAAAFAFPSAGGTGAVIFSDALLEMLTPEETAAVFAHEVAHLEHFTPRRMRRMQVVASLLVVAILSLAVALRSSAPDLHAAFTFACAGVALLAFAARARRSRGQETASDLRGAELCGDAESLVRALTKLHAALRLPRRWSADVERRATHPSLEHRIAALRAATGSAANAAAASAAAAPAAPRAAKRVMLAAAVAVGAVALTLLFDALVVRRDPYVAGPTPAWRGVPARIVSATTVAGMARDIVVSPSGGAYVARLYPSYHTNDGGGAYAAVGTGGPRFALGALATGAAPPLAVGGAAAAAFVGEDSLLLLSSRASGPTPARGMELRLSAIVAAAAGSAPGLVAPSWRLALPMLVAPELRVDAATGRWSVTGRLPGAPRTVTTLEGRLGDSTFVGRDWPEPPSEERDAGYAAVTPLADGSALAVRLRSDRGASLPLTLLLGATPWTTELSLLEKEGGHVRGRLLATLPGFARCVGGGSGGSPAGGLAAACVLMDARGRSRIVAVTAHGVETLATIAEPVTSIAMGRDGRRIALAAVGPRGGLLLLGPTRDDALRLTLPTDLATIADVRWTSEGDVVVMGYGKEGTKIVRVGLR